MVKVAKGLHLQAGDFLVESLIGVFLLGIIGVGVTFMATGIQDSQRQLAVQQMAINQLKNIVASQPLASICGGLQIQNYLNEQVNVNAVSGCNLDNTVKTTTATVNGVELDDPFPMPIRISANLAGEDEFALDYELGVAQVEVE